MLEQDFADIPDLCFNAELVISDAECLAQRRTIVVLDVRSARCQRRSPETELLDLTDVPKTFDRQTSDIVHPGSPYQAQR
jgi:hypothetical protein